MAGLLRLITCGSVDDGKSTLLGRLLVETGALSDDQMAALLADSARPGGAGAGPDYALLLDGLAAEREQGITIDIAWRYFATPRRSFVVADCPGHARYTRNMVTGASTAELALLLVDATRGLTRQTLRHAAIVALLGIRQIILVVNKIDLVGFEESRFAAVAGAFGAYAAGLEGVSVTALPVSARHGDNVVSRSPALGWYEGPALLDLLETVMIEPGAASPLRLPVQWVNRTGAGFRGYAGTLAAGVARTGARVVNSRTGETAAIARILGGRGDGDEAVVGDAVTVMLDAAIDAGRGDVLAAEPPPVMADQFAAHMVWLGEAPGLAGRSYLFKLATTLAGGSITDIRHAIDPETRAEVPARTLAMNDIAVVHVAFDRPVAYSPYRENRTLGGFIVIDRASGETVGAGMIDFALYRGTSLHRQRLSVDRAARAASLGQRPVALWFTGLSGAGKSTIADLVEQRLHEMGAHTYLIDGDNLRHGLNRDLGFTEADRVENIRRAAEVGRLLVDAGLIVLASFISPYAADRAAARALFGAGEFVEVFVDAPLSVCENRDPKGLYAKARRGELRHFTGLDAPYESPAAPEIHLRSDVAGAAELADQVVAWLRTRGAPG